MKKIKNILIATGIYPPQIGGPATYAKLLNDLLPKEGFSVEVISFDSVRNYPKVIRHFVYFLKLLFLAPKFDEFFVQDTVSVGFPAFIVAKIFRKKMILRVPGDYAWEQGVQRFGVKEDIDKFQDVKSNGLLGFIRRIQILVARHSDIVIVPSNYFKTIVLKWGVLEERLCVIYNGVEEINIGQKKERFEKGFTLITAGRLVPWKGVHELIRVFKELKKNIIGAKLVIVGDGPCKQDLINFVMELGLEESIEITGRLSRADLISRMLESDIFVLNSGFESFSFQVVEAMALGLVVVVSDSGSLKEVVEDGVSGMLFKNSYPDSMVPLVMSLYNNKDRMDVLSKNAIDRSKKFSFTNTIEGLKKIL